MGKEIECISATEFQHLAAQSVVKLLDYDLDAFHGSIYNFMTAGGQLVANYICPYTKPIHHLRNQLITEEANETLEAARLRDRSGVVDGLCDLLYVIGGTVVAVLANGNTDKRTVKHLISFMDDMFFDFGSYASLSQKNQWAYCKRSISEQQENMLSLMNSIRLYSPLSKKNNRLSKVASEKILMQCFDYYRVIFDVAYKFGIAIQDAFMTVHASNMTKFVLMQDGSYAAVRSPTGKILKPASYCPVNLKQF